ncbi:MAG TPA: hypothetical protein VF729_02340 [Solirubrobacterales bacterium]
MTRKLKALGLGLLATMAVSAIAVNASAEVTGHFVVDGTHAIVTGTEGGTHNTKFSVDGGTPIECLEDSYSGVIGAQTVAGFTVTPTHKTCRTEGSATHNVTVTTNGCTYTFKATEKTHATFWFLCGDKFIEIHHPNCTIKIPDQIVSGVSYTTVVENGKHALTTDFTIENIAIFYEAGICTFLGTNHNGSLKGSITLRATDTAGNPVNLTVT